MNGAKLKNILITGGAGFIGSHLTDELLSRGYPVTVFDNLRNGTLENLSAAQKKEGFLFFKGDILDKEDCSKVIQGKDLVFHLACLGVRHSLHSPFENHRVNAEGTLNILEACRQNNIQKFFYISSSEIYGKTLSFPIRETDTPYPITVYGSGKLAGEHYTHSFNECYNLDTTVLRIFNNYGPRAHYEGDAGEIIPRSIVSILLGKKPIIFGDGSVTRDFFYVKDTAKMLADLIPLDGITGQTFNLGTGLEISMKDLLHKLVERMPEYDTQIEYFSSRPADVPRLWVDTSKIRQKLNLDTLTSFSEGLGETIQFYKKLLKEKKIVSDIPRINWEINKTGN